MNKGIYVGLFTASVFGIGIGVYFLLKKKKDATVEPILELANTDDEVKPIQELTNTVKTPDIIDIVPIEKPALPLVKRKSFLIKRPLPINRKPVYQKPIYPKQVYDKQDFLIRREII